MRKVLLLGAGKIGRMIARFLVDSGDYDLLVADANSAALERLRQRVDVATHDVNAGDHDSLLRLMRGRDTVISALSFHFNPGVARAALEAGCSYFDLTEDISTTDQVQQIAADAKSGQIFMPQSGLAPGFISIVAAYLFEQFDSVDSVRMRVGALPQYPVGALKYNLTWSTDGLINEYCNACEAIHDGALTELLPLEGLEHFSLDGVNYEAFNTSGGLATLCETLAGKVRELNYKTIRYLGHRDLVAFLLNELRLNERREVLKDILETAIPVTFQDVVVTFCTVKGQRRGQFAQLTDARKVYHQEIGGEIWSAIQVTTAAGVCAVLDLFFEGRLPESGFVKQEQVSLSEFLHNRFGSYYDVHGATRLATEFSPESAE
jgi:saccharopine dehydrogenase-like NADP-dependent oxidoreductase